MSSQYHRGTRSGNHTYAAARRILSLGTSHTGAHLLVHRPRRSAPTLFFKCENFQKSGSFKIRGATNAVLSLSDEEAKRGVATHSSGNHAGALALAARNRGIQAHVVMPKGAPQAKKDSTARYGAQITFCDNNLAARERALQQVVQHTGAVVIHPYDDYRIIAGQGSAALELLEDQPDLDIVLTPVGGGGLTSGAALVVRDLASGTKMMAAEPAAADDAFRSHRDAKLIPSEDPHTIADGLRTSLGKRTFPIVRDHVNEIITVSETGIVAAMRIIWERMKIVVEPSSAVPLGALMENMENLSGKRIGVVVSGGNVDMERLPWAKAAARK